MNRIPDKHRDRILVSGRQIRVSHGPRMRVRVPGSLPGVCDSIYCPDILSRYCQWQSLGPF